MEHQKSNLRVQHSHCPYCKDAVQPGQEKVACDACMAWHHRECWHEHGACSGCGGAVYSGGDAEALAQLGEARGAVHTGLPWRAEWTAQATGTGRKVSWTGLREGKLLARGCFSLGFTTVVPDAIDDMIQACRKLDPKCKLELLKSNDMTNTSFLLEVEGEGFQVRCRRTLVRGWFPLNPIAAEFGANYDADFDVRAGSQRVRQALSEKLQARYPPVGGVDERGPAEG